MMGNTVRRQLEEGKNPFRFSDFDPNNYDDSKPLVIMASPGMLQKGLSRDLFEKWCDNPKHGLVFTGYSVENTLAKIVMNHTSGKEIEF